MIFYFTFFNGEISKDFTLEGNSTVKMNMNKFKMSFFQKEAESYYKDEITSYELMIEKENEGNFVFNNKIIGIANEGIVEFANAELKDSLGDNLTYKLYVNFKQGGLTVFTTKDKPCFVQLKTINTEFKLLIHDAIEINKIFELQSNEDVLKFDVSIQKSWSTFKYYFYLSPNKTADPIKENEFIPVSGNYLKLSTKIQPSFFKDNMTYLHFYLMDSFGNVNTNSVVLTTKNNSMTLLSVLNPEAKIINWEDEFGILYESRNVERMKPILVYYKNNTRVQVDGRDVISTYDKRQKSFSMKLSDYFEKIQESDVSLFFILNNDTKLVSNEIHVSIDNTKPVVEITNIDGQYKLISDKEVDKYHITGKIIDKNFFFIGNSVKKINLHSNYQILLIKSNEDLKEARFGSVTKNLIKFNNYYYCESVGETFTVYTTKNKQTTNFVALNDYCANGKSFYIWFHKDDLNLYEKNIIQNQGGLKFKGSLLSVLLKQEFIQIDDFYILKGVLRSDANDSYTFDIGIHDFDYSLLYRVNSGNISCEINAKKQLVATFTKTKLLLTKNFSQNSIVKFDDNKIISYKKGIHDSLINVFAVSLNTDEYFSPTSNYIFFEDNLNARELETVYYKPVLKLKEQSVPYKNYICKQISDTLYNFELDVDLKDGENDFTLIFNDVLRNETQCKFVIEKNYKNIAAVIHQDNIVSFNLFEGNKITTNKDSLILSFEIINETKQLKTKDKIIRIKSHEFIKQQIIQDDHDKRMAIFDFTTSEEETKYEIFYNDLLMPIGSFTLQRKNELLLRTTDGFVSGMNHYFLNVETDKFANISVVHNNNEIFECIVDKNIIDIVRKNNVNITEEIDLEITCFDPTGLYNSVSKNVHGIFYNDNIIEQANIVNHNASTNELTTPSFDIALKLNKSEFIEYIRAYDKSEINFNKRFKYAKKEKDSALITDITTPILPSPVELNIKIQNLDFVIKKYLFQEKPISYLVEKNDLLVNFAKKQDKLEIVVKNDYKEEVTYKKLELFKDGILFHSEQDFKIKKIKKLEFDLSLFMNKQDILLFLYNDQNKIVFSYSELIEFDEYVENKATLKGFESHNVKTISDIQNVQLELSAKDNYNYSLEVIDVFNRKKAFPLNKSFSTKIDITEGIYTFELYAHKFNSKKKIQNYVVEVIENFQNTFEYSDEYSYIRYINDCIITSSLSINPQYLGSKIIYTHNDIKKVIEPYKIENKKIYFQLPKQIGKNDYAYANKYISEPLKSINLKPLDDIVSRIEDIYTEDGTLFVRHDNKIILHQLSNVMVHVKNYDYINIDSFHLVQKIRVLPKQKFYLSKSYLPCKLEFIKNGNILEKLEFSVDVIQNDLIPIEENLDIKILKVVPFVMRSLNTKRQELHVQLKNRTKHFLLEYAQSLGNQKWNQMPLLFKEQFLSQISIQVFEKIKELNVEKIKDRIKKEISEFK